MPAAPDVWIDARRLPPPAALAEEDCLLEDVAAGRRPATLRLWSMPEIVVCPSSYRRRWERAEAARLENGGAPPVPAPLFRTTGGGIVAIAPGVTFWTLAWASPRGAALSIDAAYHRLAVMLRDSLAVAGVAADVVEVPDAMCRGRYDIAIGGRKVAGLSQRRIERGPHDARVSALLVHAFILENADIADLSARCNALADYIGVPGTRPDALLSLHDYLGKRVTLEVPT